MLNVSVRGQQQQQQQEPSGVASAMLVASPQLPGIQISEKVSEGICSSGGIQSQIERLTKDTSIKEEEGGALGL